MSKKITIILVDDHAVVRAGIKRLLEQESLFEVIGEAENGEKAYQMPSDDDSIRPMQVFKADMAYPDGLYLAQDQIEAKANAD